MAEVDQKGTDEADVTHCLHHFPDESRDATHLRPYGEPMNHQGDKSLSQEFQLQNHLFPSLGSE